MNILRQMGNAVIRPSVKEFGSLTMSIPEPNVATKKATFAMSWFWFPDAQFGSFKGIIRTRVGYTGGTTVNPTYYNLGDHTETIDLDYDPEQVDFSALLGVFWKNHDPTSKCSRQYMSAIFYHDDDQKNLAEKTLKEAQLNKNRKITTKILPAEKFYDAEDYHQKYLLQQHPWLVKAMNINPGTQMITSHVAARVNGYIGGYGKVSDFEAECSKLGLNEKMAEYIKTQLRRNHRG